MILYRHLYIILYYLDKELQDAHRSSEIVTEYLIEHGQKLCARPDDIINKQLRLWYCFIAYLALVK